MRRVVVVGAGFIAPIHAEVLREVPGVELWGVVDRRESAARTFAQRWRIPRVFGSIEKAIRSGQVDCAHVLTSPDQHAAAALPFLKAKIPVLIEKPLAANGFECKLLQEAADRSNTTLGVNQNYIYHPAFARLHRFVVEARLGGLRAVDCLYHVPLRQLVARQFGHWMFKRPVNLLLEQAVHPLSQVISLAGESIEPLEILSMPDRPIDIEGGEPLQASYALILRRRELQAHLRIAVGESFPLWQIIAICDDGAAVADITHNRFFTYRRTRWFEPADSFVSGSGTAASLLRNCTVNAVQYALSTARLMPRGDPFFRSMKQSIGAFHAALDRGAAPNLDGAFGAHLVGICEHAARTVHISPTKAATAAPARRYEVLVLGGTGFIGRHVVERLLSKGYRVGVMARNAHNRWSVFNDERVVLMQGDASSGADIDPAVAAARIVINLAHGGGQGNYSEIRSAMVGAVEAVSHACLLHRVERLIHIGSIASLYLGPQAHPVTGSTAPDAQAHRRSAYARAKAECDRILLELHAAEGLPICILRPGVVIGQGGIAAHGALGYFNNDQHCIGWNSGRNPLPFVLVEDVAEAVCLACTARTVIGRSYNLVGDVRLTAREYISELGQAVGRPIRYHPKSPTALWLQELGRWVVKAGIGRRAPLPSLRDLRSRGLAADFDCSDAQRDLGWRPTRDRTDFIARGIRIHSKRSGYP